MLHALEVLALRIYMAIFKVVTALMPFKWPRMFEGTGSSLELIRHMANAGHRNVLVVTDAVLVKLGVLDNMKAELETQGVKYVVYDGVEPNPTVEQIEAGYRMLMENGCQAILAVGGGSPIDAAKMIGARAKNNKPVLKLTGLLRVHKGMIPLFAVPTTAGTGAEVTIAAVVSDQSGISIETAAKALCSSRIARTTAIITTPAKIARSKASANQINATSESETTMEGNNLRPARLLIASLIECRSDIFYLTNS